MSDRFDELLGKVLSEESAVEPRAGLERRVMARVGERSAAASRRWMFAAWAGGLAVVAVVLVVLLPGRPVVRAVRHDGLAVSNPAAASLGHGLPSGAKASSRSMMYGILRPRSGQASEAVPLSKTGRSPDDVSRGVSAERAAAPRRSGASGKQVVQAEEAALPKLDVFPSPAPVDVFPGPVADERQDAAAELSSPKAAEALLALQKEQKEPIQVAAIQIAPLEPDAGRNR